MAIDYNDERFTELKQQESDAKQMSNNTYESLINQSDKYYNDLINQSKSWADKQADIQNQQTEFAVEKIEQQKQQAEKDYTKEQKGAYQDYMKQSNAYGSNMQTMGQQGLSGGGWSETIQSGYYNTYQNRYAKARESYNEIVMNYNNNIKEAELQNSSALATIYAEAQQQQLELALQNFTVIKDLKLNKLSQGIALDNEYNNRWRQVESQINTENSLAEQIRQYNESLAEQKRQADLDNSYRQQQLALQKQQLAQEQANWEKQFNAQYGSSSKLSSGSSSKSSSSSSKLSSNSSKSSSSGSLKDAGKSAKKAGSSSSGTVKLSNGKTGYSNPIDAYKSAGGGSPYSQSALIKKGLVKQVTYNGKTYYYA